MIRDIDADTDTDTDTRVLLRARARHTWLRPLSRDELRAAEQRHQDALDQLSELRLQLAELLAQINPKIKAARRDVYTSGLDLERRDRAHSCNVRTEYDPASDLVHVLLLDAAGIPCREIEARRPTRAERIMLSVGGPGIPAV